MKGTVGTKLSKEAIYEAIASTEGAPYNLGELKCDEGLIEYLIDAALKDIKAQEAQKVLVFLSESDLKEKYKNKVIYTIQGYGFTLGDIASLSSYEFNDLVKAETLHTILKDCVEMGYCGLLTLYAQKVGFTEKDLGLKFERPEKTLIRTAACEGSEYALKVLLALSGGPQYLADQPLTDDKRTPMHLAAVNGHLGAVEEMLKYTQGKESLSAKTRRLEKTPMHEAARYGHTSTVEAMLKFPQGRKTLNTKDSDGYTPIYYAAKQGHTSIIEAMLNTTEGQEALSLSDVRAARDGGHKSTEAAMVSKCPKGEEFKKTLDNEAENNRLTQQNPEEVEEEKREYIEQNKVSKESSYISKLYWILAFWGNIGSSAVSLYNYSDIRKRVAGYSALCILEDIAYAKIASGVLTKILMNILQHSGAGVFKAIERSDILTSCSTIFGAVLLSKIREVVFWDLTRHLEGRFIQRMIQPENQAALALSDEKVDLDEIKSIEVWHLGLAINMFLNIGITISQVCIANTGVLRSAAQQGSMVAVASVFRGAFSVHKMIELVINFMPIIAMYLQYKAASGAIRINGELKEVTNAQSLYIGATNAHIQSFNKTFEKYLNEYSLMQVKNVFEFARNTVTAFLGKVMRPIQYASALAAGPESAAYAIVNLIFNNASSRLNMSNSEAYMSKLLNFYGKQYLIKSAITSEFNSTRGGKVKNNIALSFNGCMHKSAHGETEYYPQTYLQIKYGAITAIYGEIGCGKTTLAEMFAGFSRRSTNGDLLFFGLGDQASDIQYIPSKQQMPFKNLPLLEYLISAMKIDSENQKDVEEQAMEILKSLGLQYDVNAPMPPNPSNGEMKLILLAKGMLQKAKLLILDETLGGLDVEYRAKVMGVITSYAKDNNAAVVVVSHQRDLKVTVSGKAQNFESSIIEFKDGKIQQYCTGKDSSRTF